MPTFFENVALPPKQPNPTLPTIDHATLVSLLDYSKETGVFVWRERRGKVEAGSVAGHSHDKRGYLRVRLNRKSYYMHRLAWFYVHGVWPKEELDHINSVKSDNRIANLREASHAQNNSNKPLRPDSSTGVAGVRYDTRVRKYVAYITINKQYHGLGSHTNIVDAVAQRLAAEKRMLQGYSFNCSQIIEQT